MYLHIEVGVFTYCDELRMDKAKRTEVDVGYYGDELRVDRAIELNQLIIYWYRYLKFVLI
jgi:hypothetical protein